MYLVQTVLNRSCAIMQTYHGAKRANIISCKYNYSGRNQRQEGRKQLHTLSYYIGENEHKIYSCGELKAERLGYASLFGTSRPLVVNELYKFKKPETKQSHVLGWKGRDRPTYWHQFSTYLSKHLKQATLPPLSHP